jgi:serine/threonine protein kinase
VAETLRLGTPDIDGDATRPEKTRSAPQPRKCPECSAVFTEVHTFCPIDGKTLVAVPKIERKEDKLIGKKIDGRYEVKGLIGEGGMGSVYEVRHVGLDRSFALKILRREYGSDKTSVERFLQEARVAAAIEHEHLVAVTDFGEVDGRLVPKLGDKTLPYFVMEKLEGESLAALLRREGKLDTDRAVRIAYECALGLTAMHAGGVIHRDLKPHNVFMVRRGEREQVKLLDFGVAKVLGASRLTKTGTVFGTPYYMSPEQAGGDEVDGRADVYSLGVIIYEMMAGRVPFRADSFMGVLTKHMFEEPEPLEEVTAMSASFHRLAPVAMKCLQKHPEHRYASAEELARELERIAKSAAREGPARSGAMRKSSKSPPAASAKSTTDDVVREAAAASESSPPIPGLAASRAWVWGLVAVLLAAGAGIAYAFRGEASSAPPGPGEAPTATSQARDATAAPLPTSASTVAAAPTAEPAAPATSKPASPALPAAPSPASPAAGVTQPAGSTPTTTTGKSSPTGTAASDDPYETEPPPPPRPEVVDPWGE